MSVEMSGEEIENWHNEQNKLQRKIMDSSPEQYGLVIHGYYLPQTKRNAKYYEQVQNNSQYDQGILFFFEETTGNFQCYNSGGSDLMKQLIVYRGVSEEDIKKRSLRFLTYISTLGDMGELPGFEQMI